jgi:hypothetical protein
MSKNRFLTFFQNQFFSEKSTVSPRFLRDGKRYRAETFSTYTRYYFGCVFFFNFKKYYSCDFWQLLKKICDSKKTSFFKGVFSILAFLFERQKIQGNQNKYAPQIVSSMCKKLFSSIERSISE